MNKRRLGEKWWQFCYWMGGSKTWVLGKRPINLSILRSQRFWEGKMTVKTTMALMVAVLLFAVQDQSHAQFSDEATPTEESVADCPCGSPAELVPVATWPTTAVDCAADTTRTTVYGFSNEGGVASLVSTTYGRDCQFIADAIDLNGHERPITQSQVKACSVVILDYAQALKDAGQVDVHDFGCNLK